MPVVLPPNMAIFPIRWRAALALTTLTSVLAVADDWPQWMGPRRDGVWRETGIVEQIPASGLPVKWKVPVNAGYVGPAVVGNRVYLLDRKAAKPTPRAPGERAQQGVPGNERVLCLDAATGATVWEHAYDRAYRISYPAGPRATPVVAGDRLFTLGAMGDLKCLRTSDGTVVWQHDLAKEYTDGEVQAWGWAAHPLLKDDLLYCLVGGTNSAVVAFEAASGKERWRALTTRETGYAPPMIYDIAGKPTLVVWHTEALVGLDPATGAVRWQQAYPIVGKQQRPEVNIATPRFDGRRLFVSSFYHGATLLEPSADSVRVLWNRKTSRQSEMNDGLHTTMCTPILKGGFIYGVCGFGELRCLGIPTGDRRWESLEAVGGEQGLFAHAFLIEQGDRTWLWNDHGELILAKLDPSGYEQIGRTKLLETIENTRGRDVLWCHPAFAGRRLYVHNGRDLICVDLARS